MSRTEFPLIDLGEGLDRMLSRINALRSAPPEGDTRRDLALAEEIMDALFDASHHFAVYGSLAPGQSRHSVIEPVPGTWTDASVRGERDETGWGLTGGFPGMRWSAQAPLISVKLFISKELVSHWKRLDEFEGGEYRRILVPVHGGEDLITVANIYEVRTLDSSAPRGVQSPRGF